MRGAQHRVASVFVDCPQCGEAIASPDNGSDSWPANFYTTEQVNRTFLCDACETPCQLPKRLRDVLTGENQFSKGAA